MEPLLPDLNKIAVNIYGLIQLYGSSLIHFVSKQAKNEHNSLSICKWSGLKKNKHLDSTSKEPCRI